MESGGSRNGEQGSAVDTIEKDLRDMTSKTQLYSRYGEKRSGDLSWEIT